MPAMRNDVIVDMPGPPLEERRVERPRRACRRWSSGLRHSSVGAGLVGRALSELIQHRRGADVVPFYLAALLLIGLGMAAIRGLVAVAPGEARVVQLFGSYAGTIRRKRLALGESALAADQESRPGSAIMRPPWRRSTTTKETRSRSLRLSSGGCSSPQRGP